MRNVTIWLCHHLKLYMDFHISLKMSPFEYVTIWKHFKPVTILVWKHIFIFTIFFRPSIHMVTNVTIWVLGLKIFTPVTKKWLSNGDNQKGFTIEQHCYIFRNFSLLFLNILQLFNFIKNIVKTTTQPQDNSKTTPKQPNTTQLKLGLTWLLVCTTHHHHHPPQGTLLSALEQYRPTLG